MAAKRGLMYSSSPAAPPPSPIPTGRGSRSASSSALSDYIEKSVRIIPELTLPQNIRRRYEPEEISYESIKFRESDSVERLLRSAREFGVFRITDHGILSEELKLALGKSERVMFGLMVDHCMNYGDHEKFIWSGQGQQISGEATNAIGDNNFEIFRQEMKKVSSQLDAIAKELVKVMAPSATNGITEPFQLSESMTSIYRYHRANIIDRNSSAGNQESGPYAFGVHLILDSGEFSLQLDSGNSSFGMSNNSIAVTLGKEVEEWRLSEYKWCQGKLVFKPYLQTSRPSFSIEQKWSVSDLRNQSNNVISLWDQILILLIVPLVYKCFAYFMCS